MTSLMPSAGASLLGPSGRCDRAPKRVQVEIEGVVQGVGFRPFVFRTARALGLTGFVRNGSAGVLLEVQGQAPLVEQFLTELTTHAPPQAHIRCVRVRHIATGALDRGGFSIQPSDRTGELATSIPPDLCTCGECLRELFDPSNRRYRYPFINCTACGPRFTIARRLPYDRVATTMAAFTMCDACQAEYDDPADRRFHAQPNACATCGPCVSFLDGRGRRGDIRDPIEAAAEALRDGAIVAVKGLGGYHLACRADDPEVVDRLRQRKRRDDKPFAVMVRSLSEARRVAAIGAQEARLLMSAARPIVLVRTRRERKAAPIAQNVAPGRAELGLMLPYTPIHHLLLADADFPLVMTSGNVSDEPIAYRDEDAFARLSPIADFFLTHDRAIETRCDDSVVRVVDIGGRRQPLCLRRSRGYVPQPVPLPVTIDASILAVGGQLKNTICIARGGDALAGPHVGDLGEASTFAAYSRGIEHLTHLSETTPAIAAHDLHPEYLSTKYALDRADLDLIPVQHHHAHLAACLAEHGETGPAIGVIFDGLGYGSDATFWGGEILLGDLGEAIRVGHLLPVPMPGGERAIREPWRMACAWLTAATAGEPPLPSALRGKVDQAKWIAVSRVARAPSRAAVTTSVGRLLDACAAICGIRPSASYEGQAAIELEAAARAQPHVCGDAYPVAVRIEGSSIVIDPLELVRAAERDADAGRHVSDISACVHAGIVCAARFGAQVASEAFGVRTIVLSGGVFQNVLLLEALSASLVEDGLRVLVPRLLPPNDGGLAFGQAAVAAAQSRLRRPNVPRDSRASR